MQMRLAQLSSHSYRQRLAAVRTAGTLPRLFRHLPCRQDRGTTHLLKTPAFRKPARCHNIYKIRQRGFPVLRSLSHKRHPPRNALRLSPLFTPRGNCFIFFTLPPPRTTVSATKESFSWVTQ